MAPVVHGLEQRYFQRVDFYYLDSDDPATDPIKKELGFYGTPTLLLLDGGGNVLNTWVGLVAEEKIIEGINTALLAGK